MKSINGVNVRLFGGLGNQLFQYFAGLDLSLKSRSFLTVDSRWIEASYTQGVSDIRDFIFLKDIPIKTIQNSSELNFNLERIKTKIASKFKIIAKHFAINSPNSSGFIEFEDFKSGIELRGYYQSYKYFDNISRRFGTIDWSLGTESNSFLKLKSILNNSSFIAIHIRGTDYLKKANIYHKLDSEYYSNSLRLIKHELQYEFKNIKFYVFSDDIKYAKSVLKDLPELEFIDQEGLRASEAMVLMSLAKGIVIANSTFSYWAAMINAGNHIIAPKFWYTNNLVDKNLYPPRWTLI